MQIVPKTAGKDATNYLYGKPKLLLPSYLYESENNIKIGTAYMYVLYYRYMKRIKNPTSRIYCTIAAYNTGSTNVARAFVKTKRMSDAAKIINSKTPKQVYQTLIKYLPYKETRNYVIKVTKTMDKYNSF
jgi:membrane-bound lytic murein transglycosylase C